MIDAYRTLSRPSSSKLTRKRSRFLVDAVPVASVEDVETALAAVRKRTHDASHHCSAHRLLGEDGVVTGSDDDGEPSGSAGLPILQQIEAVDLLNVLVVVTRYFGGTKLGVGGLVRAYGDAAREALEDADVIVRELRVEVSIGFPIEVNSSVMATIHRHRAEVLEIGFEAEGRARVSLLPSGVDAFRSAIVEATGNRAAIEVHR
jgi:uncharacterized YigZ family protein